MTQLLEYGEIKLIDASSAPFRVPPHYVQIDDKQIKTEPLINPTPTDFENLIEMNARKQNVDSTADIAAATATANKMIKFEPKTIANTTVVSSSPGNISSTSASPFKGQNGALKVKNGVQQMEVDEHLPKYADNKQLINKVKIVVDNMSQKHRLDMDAGGYHLMPHPHALMAAAAAQQAAFPGYNFHSSFHLYEYSQNNQNYLNQHPSADHPNGIDDSMWRPW